MNHVEKAEKYFSNNFNCSQAVFTTFAAEMGLDEELALKIATQFGGGARKGEMCGAVSGALMVLGLKYGHCHAENAEEKKKAYQIAEELMNRFIEKKGHPTKGNFKHLVMQPWQHFIVGSMFGWVNKDTGMRRFRESLIFVGRKNGKRFAV